MGEESLFGPLEPYESALLPVGAGHEIYWEQGGVPDGQPVVFLHGGPGSGTEPRHRRFFDPAHYRVVLFDQRGCGRSRPIASVENNTTWDLVADIERLREHLAIERWLVFGGSWGSTLALAYAQTHPERVTGLILRGVWLCTDAEIDWWLHGTRTFFPENWRRFVEPIPASERDDLVAAYRRRLMDPDPAVHMPAAIAWKSYELAIASITHRSGLTVPGGERTLAMSRIMAHYITHRAFMGDGALLAGADRIQEIPGHIVHGRYDMICPPLNADRLAAAWPRARLELIPAAGHGAFEPGTAKALVDATERCKGLV